MRCHCIVVQYSVSRIHQLLTILDVSRMSCERDHQPVFGQRQRHQRVIPVRRESRFVDGEQATFESWCVIRLRAQRRLASKQRGHSRQQMCEPDVLRQIVVGAESQTGDGVKLAVASRKKYNG